MNRKKHRERLAKKSSPNQLKETPHRISVTDPAIYRALKTGANDYLKDKRTKIEAAAEEVIDACQEMHPEAFSTGVLCFHIHTMLQKKLAERGIHSKLIAGDFVFRINTHDAGAFCAFEGLSSNTVLGDNQFFTPFPHCWLLLNEMPVFIDATAPTWLNQMNTLMKMDGIDIGAPECDIPKVLFSLAHKFPSFMSIVHHPQAPAGAFAYHERPEATINAQALANGILVCS